MKSPLDLAITRLDAYTRAELPDDEAEAYEAELFGRAMAGNAPELTFRSGLERQLRAMDARGTLDLWLTRRDLARVLASGLRVVQFDLDVANPTVPVFPEQFDLLVTRIALDLTGVHRLDAEVLTPSGELLKRLPDIAFDPADGAIYTCCEAELARTAASVQTVMKLWAEDDSGRRLVCALGP